MTMIRRLVVCASLLAASLASDAQPAKKVARIGYLAAVSAAADAPRLAAFRQGLRELGYVEGQTIQIEYRHESADLQRLPEHAAELVRMNIDLLVAVTSNAAVAAKRTTSSVPIVFMGVTDPIATGLAESLARPGGNITGIFAEQIDLTVKRLELLAQIVPGARRVGVLSDQFSADQARAAAEAAPRLGLSVETIEFKNPPYEFAPAAANLRESGAGAVLALMSPVFYRQRAALADSLLRAGLPASFGLREWPEAGGLMSYGANIGGMMRKAADYADKVLKGAKPADLPVQQPTKFELVINLKTANALGLAVPPSLLARADEVIE